MENEAPSPPPKSDSLFGICQALGEDFGFNPDYLRIALAILRLVSAKIVVIGYVVAGLLVLGSRLLVPSSRSRATGHQVA
jgi:phage shock protein C